MTMMLAPINPVSSTITAKIESVGATGRPVNFVFPRPIPTPMMPPFTIASKERVR